MQPLKPYRPPHKMSRRFTLPESPSSTHRRQWHQEGQQCAHPGRSAPLIDRSEADILMTGRFRWVGAVLTLLLAFMSGEHGVIDIALLSVIRRWRFRDPSRKNLHRVPTLCRVSTMANIAPRITGPTLKVMGTLVTSPSPEMSGVEITLATKLSSGTLYPILIRLEAAGWLESRWEADEPTELGRPRRRFYRVTGVGAAKARSAFEDLAPASGWPAWA